ncbi:branched-chain amino acid ABC transporter permease [Paenibacillus naphthalenovorans]|uniref:branched-chain amino acid ABC transporter permease n=1 Tax=Paenibacillus naphthalenovorans TaxID=162209 RepID=UPI003D2DE5F7
MRKKQITVWTVVIVPVAIMLAVLPPNHYLYSMLTFVGIYALAATGLEMLMGYGGQISLGNGGFIALGAYITAILSQHGVHPVLIFMTALIGSALVAFIIGYPILKLEGYYLAIATLGFALLVQALAISMFPLTGGSSGMSVNSLTVFSNSLGERGYFILAWVIFGVGFILARNLTRTRTGRSLVAIQSNEEAASALGIYTGKVKLQIFVVSAMYAAAAGFVMANYLSFIAPDIFGLALSVDLVVMSLLGGHGVIYGPLLGSFVWVLLVETTHSFKDYKILLTGAALIVILLFMPKGIYGILQKRFFQRRKV